MVKGFLKNHLNTLMLYQWVNGADAADMDNDLIPDLM